MVKYGETIYGRHTALNTSCSEVRCLSKKVKHNSKYVYVAKTIVFHSL